MIAQTTHTHKAMLRWPLANYPFPPCFLFVWLFPHISVRLQTDRLICSSIIAIYVLQVALTINQKIKKKRTTKKDRSVRYYNCTKLKYYLLILVSMCRYLTQSILRLYSFDTMIQSFIPLELHNFYIITIIQYICLINLEFFYWNITIFIRKYISLPFLSIRI